MQYFLVGGVASQISYYSKGFVGVAGGREGGSLPSFRVRRGAWCIHHKQNVANAAFFSLPCVTYHLDILQVPGAQMVCHILIVNP